MHLSRHKCMGVVHLLITSPKIKPEMGGTQSVLERSMIKTDFFGKNKNWVNVETKIDNDET